MPNSILILHATDASDEAKQLQELLLNEGIFSLTIQETLLQGLFNIPELVSSSAGVIIVLSDLLFSDTICTVIAQHAISEHKGVCVRLKAIKDIPLWVTKPLNLEPGEMYEVEWEFLMTQLRSFLNFNTLKMAESLWSEPS